MNKPKLVSRSSGEQLVSGSVLLMEFRVFTRVVGDSIDWFSGKPIPSKFCFHPLLVLICPLWHRWDL